MNQQTIEQIVSEISGEITGRFLGKIFQLSPYSLAFDFGLKQTYLFVSVEPAAPRLYLIKRRFRDLEKQSIAPSPFVQVLRSSLGGGTVLSINKDAAERVVRLSFSHDEDIKTLVTQLTGRSANLYLLDQRGYITHALRAPQGPGQQVGETYEPPSAQTKQSQQESPFKQGDFSTISEAADAYYLQREAAESFSSRANALLAKLKKELAQNRKLQNNLAKDLRTHGDPEQHKRKGDLLLANIATARRSGNKVLVTDYYADGAPEIEIEIDENLTLQDEAARYFSLYTKAKRAISEIGKRQEQIAKNISQLEERKAELEKIIAASDEAALGELEGPRDTSKSPKTKKKSSDRIPGVRVYRSSDGYEILVGRTARINDQLTFRVARPHDMWLHAADYPGSHVIIRNTSRKEIPHRTILEAAQIAAKFSQAGDDSKVSVHYAQRKFLAKPKGAAAGLVRMSSFRTVTVQPGENVPRIHVGE